jgi:apolipoprotein N-acyltransferase
VIAAARSVAALGGSRPLLVATAGGAILALGQPPVSLPVVVFLVLPVLFRLLEATPGPRAAFALGWAAGLGHFAAALFWIVEPFLVDVPRHGWMAPFALAFMAGGLALFWALPFALARGLAPQGPQRMLALAAAWTLAEFTRSHVLTGFPWALMAQVWIETPVAQTLAVIGPHGLGLATLLAALAPAAFGWRGLAVAGAFVAAAWTFGAARLAMPVPARPEPIVVRLVQPNAPQRLKWRADMQEEFYRRHLALTAAPAEPMPAVTIWSETAVPFVLGYADDLQAEVAASAPGGPVILGIQRLDAGPDHENWFNSLAVLGPDGQPWAVYDKHHLVPFGEYIPLAGAIARLGIPRLTTLTARGFTPGPGPQLVTVPGLPPFLPLICYEAIFPHAMQAPGGRAEWMVQVTNDAWFGELAGPYQHLTQARARAIEQGLPLARAANTGVSAMIDPFGRVTAELPLGKAGQVDAVLPPALAPTTYARVGDYPTLLVMLSFFGLTVIKFCGGISFERRR